MVKIFADNLLTICKIYKINNILYLEMEDCLTVVLIAAD